MDYLDEIPKPAPPAEGDTWVDQALGGENPDDLIAVRSPSGVGGTVKRKDLQEAMGDGFRLEHPEETHERGLEKAYGDAPVATFIEAGLSTVSMGATDLIGGERLREHRKRNQTAGFLGSVAGAFVPVGGGALAAGAGKLFGATRAGAGLAGRVAGAGLRGGVEGGVFGLQAGVSEIGLSEKPVDWESGAATIGSHVLGGAAIGGGIGVGGKLLEEGAAAASRYANRKVAEYTTAPAAAEAKAAVRGDFPEIAGMDRKAAREAIVGEREAVRAGRAAEIEGQTAARKLELGRIEAAKDAAAATLYTEAKAYKDLVRQQFVATSDGELAMQLKGARNQIMRSLDNPKSFVRYRGPNALVDGLEKQEAALTKSLANADEAIAGAGAERQALLEGLPKSSYEKPVYLTPEQSKLYADHAGVTLPKGKPAITVTGDELDGFRTAIERGDVNPPGLQRVMDAEHLLEQNQALQGKIKELRAPAMSDELAEIDRRLESARSGLGKTPKLEALEAHLSDLVDETVAKKMARGAGALAGGKLGFMVGGPMGAAAGGMVGQEVGGRIFDRLVRKIQIGNATRAQSIKASVGQLFAKGSDKAARAVKRVAPLATKILPGISYAQQAYVDGMLGAANEQRSKRAAVNDFRARARELNALTERTAEGGYSVRMPARELLHGRLQALWAVNENFANGVEMTHNRRVEFLASKLPRNPAPPHLQAGPDTWEPSHAELAKFARYMDAAEHPENVLQRLSTATMTPEDAEALRTVYPSIYEDVRGQVLEHVAELRERLPYEKRLSLSIYLDVPVDPAVTTEAITVYQGLYAQQQPGPGQGGQGAPGPARKAFKSSEEPTRAQRQAEG